MMIYGGSFLKPELCSTINLYISVIFLINFWVLFFINPGIQIDDDKRLNMYKWCEVCSITRRKGTKHCEMCDLCIEKKGPHVFLLDKCIGKYTKVPYLLCKVSFVCYFCIFAFSILYTWIM